MHGSGSEIQSTEIQPPHVPPMPLIRDCCDDWLCADPGTME